MSDADLGTNNTPTGKNSDCVLYLVAGVDGEDKKEEAAKGSPSDPPNNT